MISVHENCKLDSIKQRIHERSDSQPKKKETTAATATSSTSCDICTTICWRSSILVPVFEPYYRVLCVIFFSTVSRCAFVAVAVFPSLWSPYVMTEWDRRMVLLSFRGDYCLTIVTRCGPLLYRKRCWRYCWPTAYAH